MGNNILDKIIQAQEDQRKADLNPQELVNFLLQDLNSREKEVVKARYGLDRPEKQTLESVGKKLGITRERVRQIENNALKKALETEGLAKKLENLQSLVIKRLKQSGYVQLEETLLDNLLGDGEQDKLVNKNCLRFIFEKFLKDHIELLNIVHTDRAWKVKDKNLNHYNPIVEGTKELLAERDTPLTVGEIVQELEKRVADKVLRGLQEEIESFELTVQACLEVSRHFKKNLFDKWGMSHWRSVNPKRMRDKIYLVLLKDKNPLHYKKIAERINEEKFDNKVAHPATIHNELILDDRFVLIGRGIYALRDWGYKPGVISDVIVEILKEAAGKPLSKEEITGEVMKRRIVKEGSINLTLTDRRRFMRTKDGKYILNQQAG